MKVMNVVKMASVSVLVMMMVGCASMGNSTQLTINSKNSGGLIYGKATTFIGNNDSRTEEACAAIKNADARCSEKEKYQARFVVSSIGLSDGAKGFMAIADKNLNVGNEWRGGDGVFVKATRNAGELGTILEVVTRPGDANPNCHWSGLPGAGGTVCPAFNWDYHKDNQAAVLAH
jgi:hypothetical protein